MYSSARALQKHGLIVDEFGCWIGFPAVQTFHQLKIFKALWNWWLAPSPQNKRVPGKFPAGAILSGIGLSEYTWEVSRVILKPVSNLKEFKVVL